MARWRDANSAADTYDLGDGRVVHVGQIVRVSHGSGLPVLATVVPDSGNYGPGRVGEALVEYQSPTPLRPGLTTGWVSATRIDTDVAPGAQTLDGFLYAIDAEYPHCQNTLNILADWLDDQGDDAGAWVVREMARGGSPLLVTIYEGGDQETEMIQERQPATLNEVVETIRGGYHRYSGNDFWERPHRMLYVDTAANQQGPPWLIDLITLLTL